MSRVNERGPVKGWRTTASTRRAILLAALGVGLAVVFGQPVLMALTAPYVVCTAMALLHRPTHAPTADTRLDHVSLHEGQGTRSRLVLENADDVEHVTRVAASVPYVAMHPANGRLGYLLDGDHDSFGASPELEVSPRRWGRRTLGAEKVACTSAWGGYRWGPTHVPGRELFVLPVTASFDSRAEAPAPLGLVGSNRSRRIGDGTEFAAIRPFHAGDRLRRVHWPVSLRSGALHVVASRAEEDSGVLLIVDALADHGRSGGIDGAASSLDVTMRAAAALAEHHVRLGDRVSLRVVGPRHEFVRPGSGMRHLRVILGRLAQARPGETHDFAPEHFQSGATGGTTVIILSPLLALEVAQVATTLVGRGLPVIAIDTLPDGASPAVAEGTDPVVADLAWRMRRLDRDHLLDRLSASGCPVVPWRGPGTVDDVMRRMARRAQLPVVRIR